MTTFDRVWAMPNSDTFDCKPIGDLVKEHLKWAQVSCDPFSRDKRWATYTNDLNPLTKSEYHMDAIEFCNMLSLKGVELDLAIIDPPYSPRQISGCYKGIGRAVGMKETQSALLYKGVRDALDPMMKKGAYALSFGWNTNGFGKGRGYSIEHILLVSHGGAHNDTICMVERKL